MARLIIFSGLPGVGKSTIARELACKINAFWLRIDSIEHAIKEAGIAASIEDAGYLVAHAIAKDNLRFGRDVVADCVNPWMLTRDAWRCIGAEVVAVVTEIEVVCSDPAIHRQRVVTRVGGPDWARIAALDYHIWDRDRLVIDTAGRTIDDCVNQVASAL